MKNRAGLLLCVLVTLWAQVLPQAQAFTLGDLRGAAVLGRSLDVSVQVQTGPGEALTATCVSAEVFFADTPQRTAAVTVGTMAGGLSEVRVQSSAIINEPVVTVLVHATCGSSTMRRYVLLADFPKTLLAAHTQPTGFETTVKGEATTGMPPMLVLPTATQLPAAAKPSVVTPDVKDVPKVKKIARSLKVSKNSTAGQDTGTAKAATRATGKAVLKLDPLDVFSDRMDSLDSLMLFEPTEDALKQTKQIAALQDDLKTMRALAAKNEAQLAAMRNQLEQAQTQQIPTLLVYVLLGLVVLCFAVLGWLWRKQQQSLKMSEAAWWQHEDAPSTILMPQTHHEKGPAVAEVTRKPEAPAAAPEKPRATVSLPSRVMGTVAVPVTKAAQATPEVDLDIDLDSFMLSDKKTTPPTTAPSPHVPMRSIRHINAESILDIRQQAEFFMSLGQTDRALRLLKLQIEEASESNPMVYLDLISLYHSLGLKADFRELRDAFQREFNVLVPDFPAFNVASKELEDYPEILAELTSLWPQASALVFLDTCIFHDPLVQVPPLFELNAFRDLMMLHALAEEINADLPSLGHLSAELQAPLPIKSPVGVVNPPPLAFVAPAVPSVSEVASTHVENLTLDKAHGMDFSLADDPADQSPSAVPEISLDPVSNPAPSSPEVREIPAEESPSSMMLDLDFSSLALPASVVTPPPTDDSEPIIHPPVRYATRSRLPVTKKPK
ncbi:hypothetical protein MIZ03_1168 [Rhodoferax lithotrophicus]|uniref:Tfp pilus assembly protein FimV n=1 Tax=Rhodoferax lithotrophicus TaxID=2798804 RepID=A0ABM7MJ37_9BURK|nr:hypothetical protein [Rhodoferax sp. MIZ03]BCO26288.1 hypothetical protein MIZ03_1168 [Rhodoferax sp. MIZ03]